MRKLIFAVFLVFCFSSVVFATSITEFPFTASPLLTMTQDTVLGMDSYMYTLDAPAGTPVDRRITVQELADTILNDMVAGDVPDISTRAVAFDESTDAVLTVDGQIHIRGDEDRFSFDVGAGGEVAGEVTKSMLEYFTMPIDFTYVYDRDVNHRIFLFEVNSKIYPNGIIIDYWRVTYTKDPTTELGTADLKRADDIIGVANAAVIDSISTTNGASSEDTDANINAGAVIAAGQDIYIEIDVDPVDEDVLANIAIIFHAEED